MEGEVLSLPKLISSGILDVKLAHCVFVFVFFFGGTGD